MAKDYSSIIKNLQKLNTPRDEAGIKKFWKETERKRDIQDTLSKYNNLKDLDTGEQLRTTTKLMEYGLMKPADAINLQKSIMYNASRTIQPEAPQLTRPGKINLEAQSVLRNIPVVKSIFKPVITPQSELEQTVTRNQNIPGLTPEYQKYINELGAKVIKESGAKGTGVAYEKELQKARQVSKAGQETQSFISSPELYIKSYNNLDATGQRNIINDLNETYKNYKNSTDKQLRDVAARAQLQVTLLTEKKEDLKKEGVDQTLGIDIDAFPDVQTKSTLVTKGLDFGRGAVQEFKDEANRLGESYKTVTGMLQEKVLGKKFVNDRNEENWKAYETGKIDKRQFEYNQAQIDDWFDRAIGTDTSLGARLRKAAGASAYWTSFLVPGSRFLKGGNFVLKAFLGDIGVNAVLGGATVLKDKEVTWKNVATNAAVSALMASSPYIFKGSSNALNNFRTMRKLEKAAVRGAGAPTPTTPMTPEVADFLAKIDNASTHSEPSKRLYEILSDETISLETRQSGFDYIKNNLSDEDYAQLRLDVEDAVNGAREINDAITQDLQTKIKTTKAEEPAVETQTTVEPTVTTTKSKLEAAVKEATEETQAELTAKKQLTITNTMKRDGDNFVFNVTDKNGKTVATIKEVDMPSAQARLQQIKENPAQFAKTFKNLFEETPKLKERSKATLKSEEIKEPPRPRFLQEGQVVAYVTDANGKDVAYIRDAAGKDIRKLTAAEVTQAKAYAKKRVEYFKLQEETKKLQATQIRAESDKKEGAPVKTKKAPAKTKEAAALTVVKEKPKYKESVKMNVNDAERASTIIDDYNSGVKDGSIDPKKEPFNKWSKDRWNTLYAEDKRFYPKAENVVLNKDGTVKYVKITYAKGTYERLPLEAEPKNVTKAVKAGAKEMDKLKEAPPKTTTKEQTTTGEQKELPRAIPGKPKQAPAKGGERFIEAAIQDGRIDKYPELAEVARYTPEKWRPYEEKYQKQFLEDPEFVDDVIAGRKQPTGKYQKEFFTLMLERDLQKGDAQTWWKRSQNSNIQKSESYTKAAESGQYLSLFSYFNDKYDINAVITKVEKDRYKRAELIYNAKGTKIKDVIKKTRDAIDKSTPEIKREDVDALISQYGGKKNNPLIQAWAKGDLNLEKMVKMTPDERLAYIDDIVMDRDLALKFASDFEKKLLLKNQKAGLINWVKSANIDSATKKDIIDQITERTNVFDPSTAGSYDNLIETALGVRLTKGQQIGLFNLQKTMLTQRDSLIKKFGSEEAWRKHASTTDTIKWKDGKFQRMRGWEPSPEELSYGRALADVGLYLEKAQHKNWKDFIDDYKAIEGKLWKIPVESARILNDTARGLQSSLDNSFIGRQGSQVMKTDPLIWLNSAKKSYQTFLKAYANPEEAERAFRAYILADPWSEIAAKNGLAVFQKDDIFNSPILSRTKVNIRGKEYENYLARPYKSSELSYDMAGQSMRLALFKKYYTEDMNRLAKLGNRAKAKYGEDSEFANIEMPKDYPKNLAKYINSLTGRGSLGKVEIAKPYLNLAFYSTGFLKSQIDKITQPFTGIGIGGVTYKSGFKTHWNPVQRRAVFNLTKILATTASMLNVADALMPGSVEKDPKSSDFGKIRIGNTRFDVTGGMGQFIVLGARLFSGKSKNSNTGIISELNSEEYGAKTKLNLVEDFFGNKASPYATQIMNNLRGTDLSREKPSVGDAALKLITPMIYNNIQELRADPNAANAFWSAWFDFNGISANTYAAAGAGRRGTEWEKSKRADVAGLAEAIGEAEFKKAARKADVDFNTFVSKVKDTEEYKNMGPKERSDVLRVGEAQIKKDIFKSYNYKYIPDRQSETERQIIKNLVNKNL